jgi:hypothetical protein
MIFFKSVYTLPSNISIEVDSNLEITDLKDFKKHRGILNLKPIKINDFLENTINKILSGKVKNQVESF